jgi:hypothetical protein
VIIPDLNEFIETVCLEIPLPILLMVFLGDEPVVNPCVRELNPDFGVPVAADTLLLGFAPETVIKLPVVLLK